jgi:hypothetical protein
VNARILNDSDGKTEGRVVNSILIPCATIQSFNICIFLSFFVGIRKKVFFCFLGQDSPLFEQFFTVCRAQKYNSSTLSHVFN